MERTIRVARQLLAMAPLVLALTGIVVTGAAADGGTPPSWIVWRANLVGTIGGKFITAYIARVGGKAKGDYCYGASCSHGVQLTLAGAAPDRRSIEMDETRARDGSGAVTGHWSLTTIDGHITGVWSSPDRQRRLPIVLRYAHATHEFGFEMAFEAAAPCAAIAECQGRLVLYRGGRRIQELATPSLPDSPDLWELAAPEIVDMNFDGWPDLNMVDGSTMGPGPNSLVRAWLYDQGHDRMEQSGALDDVISPAFDWSGKRVISEQRHSCCEHGIEVYAWQGGRLARVASGDSYQMPVRTQDKIVYCYIVPEWSAGRFRYRPAPLRRGGTIAFNVADHADDCPAHAFHKPDVRVDIYADRNGRQVVVSSEPARWREVGTQAGPRFCLDMPVLDGNRVVHLVDDGDDCRETDPNVH